MKQYYFVEYNGKFIAMYKRIHAALKFIERKGLRDDYNNSLNLVDNDGDMYSPLTGELLEF